MQLSQKEVLHVRITLSITLLLFAYIRRYICIPVNQGHFII